jgi:two-component system, NtrC family, nitrogen regulation response regulator GlnG
MHVFSRTIGSPSVPESPYLLLVDDEEASFLPLAKLVQIAGYPCVAARSAIDAIACCDHRRPDVVVTDLVMPGPDGRDLARRVHKRFPEVPILLLTGQNLEHPDWTIPSGLFEAILPKPLDFDRFLALLGRLMPPPKGRGVELARP